MFSIKKPLLLIFLALFSVLFFFFFVGTPPRAEKIKWGVNFSQKQAELLGLNWQETYLALLDDLKVKEIRLITHWDKLEPEKDKFYFEDLDWQIKEAEKRNTEILLVIGMKTPRWPECHIPDWAKGLSKEEQQIEILELLETVVLRYRGSTPGNLVWGWQVENEPYFSFGECPWSDEEFLKKEIRLLKSLDVRPVLISDSGEGSFWFKAAKAGDIVGTSLYRKVWMKQIKHYVSYPLPEIFYYRRAQLIEKFFGKKVICVELQAEPWGPSLLYDSPIEEQEKSMNLEQFKNIIAFAKRTGFDEFYFWGAEWWYWLKVKHDDPSIWDETIELFQR